MQTKKTQESCVTISGQDIMRVKALGFLHNKGTNCFNGRILTRNGRLTAKESACIAQAAEKFGDGHVVNTVRLTVEVSGIPYEKIEDFRAFLAKEGLETGGTGAKVRPIVSCKGTTCQYGLCDTYALSEKIHEYIYHGYNKVMLPHKFKIAVGGCPNNCAKPDLNDLGIIGQLIPQYSETLCKGCKKCQVKDACPVGASKIVDGVLKIEEEKCNHCGRCVGKCPFQAIPEGKYAYKIYVGGRWGKKIACGQALNTLLYSEKEVFDVIERAILLFKEQGYAGERFSDTIARIGFEKTEDCLLHGDLLERKAEILAAPIYVAN